MIETNPVTVSNGKNKQYCLYITVIADKATTWKLLPSSLKLANPDIPETGWIAVVLQPKGPFAMCHDLGLSDVFRCSFDFGVVMNQNAVVKYRDSSGSFKRAVAFEFWCDENHIVRLPSAWRSAGIHHGDRLFVDGTSLSVSVGSVVI